MKTSETKKISSQVMELKDLISGPLVATIDADSISSRQYLNYLFEVAFESYNKETGEVGKMRMLTFNLSRKDISGSATQKISIPLLSLVPLPLLQVKEADFDFEIQILDAVKEEREETFSIIDGGVRPMDTTDDRIKLRASLAPSFGDGNTKGSFQQGLSANMKINVKMRQADIPGGLANLLHLTANNMCVEERLPEKTNE